MKYLKIKFNLFYILLFIVLKYVINNNNINPYKVLGVNKRASFDEIRQAYKKKVVEYHPDKNINNPDILKVKEKMRIINNAYEVLKEKNKDNEKIENNDNMDNNNEYNQDESNDDNLNTEERTVLFIFTGLILFLFSKKLKLIIMYIIKIADISSTIAIIYIIISFIFNDYFHHILFGFDDTEFYIKLILSLIIGILIYFNKSNRICY